MEYLKIWVSFREVMECLEDDEKGRLFEAMLVYAETGEEPVLRGNERFVWPCARQNIRRAAEECKRLSANGKQGGRPRKDAEPAPAAGQPVPAVQPAEQPEPGPQPETGTKETPDLLTEKARKELTGLTDTHRAFLSGYRRKLGDELVAYAIDEAVAHGARSWAYVDRILRNYVRENIRSVTDARAADEKHRAKSAAPYVLQRGDDEYDRLERRGMEELFGQRAG